MPLSLLVSTQTIILIMASHDSIDLVSSQLMNESEHDISEKESEKILCNHCLRTLSNGIRCMGICVADNDY